MKYVACEDFNFIWEEKHVFEVIKAWNDGLSLYDIAKAFKRDPDEVALLIIDLASKREIKNRKGGLHGQRIAN